MKHFTLIALVFVASLRAYSQSWYQIPTSHFVFEEPIKPPVGTVWINPIADASKKVKEIPDTLDVVVPSIARFYFDADRYNHRRNSADSHQLFIDTDPLYFCTLKPTEYIKPFLIKQTEVSNEEYREFLHALGSKERYEEMKPDTTTWVTDFPLSYNGPMRTNYWKHPAYASYPVVGVSYYQAKAYCAWYQNKLNAELGLQRFKVVVDLPNQFEWGYANGNHFVTHQKDAKPHYQEDFYDKDYLTNLPLTSHDTGLRFMENALAPAYNNRHTGTYMNDGSMYPHSTMQRKRDRYLLKEDQVGDVFHLNSNVSEWCSETYVDNWKYLFEERQRVLRKMNTRESNLIADIERYYNSYNDTLNGQLVRGGNWFYEQHVYRRDKNVGTHAAKIFIDPNAQHSTLGFRYVIRLVPILELSEH